MEHVRLSGDAMRKLLALLLLPLSCLGATITGYIIDHAGAAKEGQITFRPLSTPMLIGTQYVSGAQFSVTLTNGGFTNTMLLGDYLLIIGGQESPRISVPDNTNTYNFVDLINTNGLLYAFKQPGAVVKLDQYDSVFGFLGDKITFTSPLATTTNNFGANESVTLAIPRGTNGVSGYLHSSDWSSFTAKQDDNNWLASGATNATLPGIGSANEFTATNGLTLAGSRITAWPNWIGSGTTNSTLAGIGAAHQLVATNAITLAGVQRTTWPLPVLTVVTGATVTFNGTNYITLVLDGVTNKIATINE
jgi:hypothetical protein